MEFVARRFAEPDERIVLDALAQLAGPVDLAIEDRGEHTLRGIDGARRLFAVGAR